MNQLFWPADPPPRDEPTRRDLIRLLFKHRGLILGTFLGSSVLIGLMLLALPPTYRVEAKVEVLPELEGTPTFFGGVAAYRDSGTVPPANRRMETEMELIGTRPIAERVVRDLGLTWEQVYHPPYAHLLDGVGTWFDRAAAAWFDVSPDEERHGFDETVRAFLRSVDVAPVESKSDTNSTLIQVKLRGPDAVVARRALAHLLATYIAADSGVKSVAGQRAYRIVDRQMARSLDEVSGAQGRLQAFLGEHGYPERRAAGAEAPLPGSNAAQPDSGPPSFPREFNAVAVLKERLLRNDLDLVEMRQRYAPSHERVRELERVGADLRLRIDAELKRSARSEARLLTLERELKAAEGVYLELRKRREQIALYVEMVRRGEGSRVVVEPPRLPRQSEWRSRTLAGMIGSFGALLVGLLLAGIREYTDHRLEDSDAVRAHLGMDVLVTFPIASQEASHAAADRTSAR